MQLFDFGVTDTGSFYYVMERLRGIDLQRMVERHGPLPPERVVFLLKQACLSLSEAHARGLVHRDIKPANLFVCRLGPQYDFLKVLDFGVVTATAARDAPITVTGIVLGTPAFLAPELSRGERPFDGRADIYALGCVAFWLLTGRPPFEATDAMALLMQHSTMPPPVPSAFCEAADSAGARRADSRVPVEGTGPATGHCGAAGAAPRRARHRGTMDSASRARVVGDCTSPSSSSINSCVLPHLSFSSATHPSRLSRGGRSYRRNGTCTVNSAEGPSTRQSS